MWRTALRARASLSRLPRPLPTLCRPVAAIASGASKLSAAAVQAPRMTLGAVRGLASHTGRLGHAHTEPSAVVTNLPSTPLLQKYLTSVRTGKLRHDPRQDGMYPIGSR